RATTSRRTRTWSRPSASGPSCGSLSGSRTPRNSSRSSVRARGDSEPNRARHKGQLPAEEQTNRRRCAEFWARRAVLLQMAQNDGAHIGKTGKREPGQPADPSYPAVTAREREIEEARNAKLRPRGDWVWSRG